MKKALFSIFAVCALFACNKVEKEAPVQEQGTSVTFNITVSGTDDTKAVKSAWATGDVINIFFEGLEEKYLCITYNSEATPKWAVSMPNGNITAGEIAALTKELTAVHFPVAVDVVWDDTNKKFDFTAGGNPVYNYYLFQEDAAYTVDEDVVTVTLALGKPGDFVWFHVNGIQANPELYKLMEPSITPVACTSVAKTGGVAETLGTAGYPLTGIADADGAIYAGRKTSAQSTYAFQLVKVNSATDMIAEGTYTKSGTKTFVAGKQYALPAPASWDDWNQWVDMGLASGLLWATGNLDDTEGSSPCLVKYYEYGGKYAWGETAQRYYFVVGSGARRYLNKFTQENAPFYSGSAYTSYIDSEHTTLAPSHDAASALLGGSWRMPTYSEMSVLTSGEHYVEEDSHNGWRFIGPNGLCIFLPKAGYVQQEEVLRESYFFYRTSSVCTDDYTYTYVLKGWDSLPQKYLFVSGDRYSGYSIRPVMPSGL